MGDLRELLSTKEFWFFYQLGEEHELDEELVRQYAARHRDREGYEPVVFRLQCPTPYTVEIEVHLGLYTVNLLLANRQENERYQLGWWDEARWHPFALRWVEVQGLLRYWEEHPGSCAWGTASALLLLARFVGSGVDESERFPARRQRVAAAYNELGLFSPREIEQLVGGTLLKPPEDDYRWTRDATLGWVFGGVDPKAFFVGPVVQEFADGPLKLETVNLAKFVHAERNLVRSSTGELAWGFGKGVVAVNALRAQGATGFLKEAGRINLGDIAIEAGNEYGTILAVSLDGQPLRTSRRILVQAAMWDQPYGFETRKQGEYERITSLGGYPLNVEKIAMRVAIKAAAGRSAVVLDENGYRTERRAEAGAAGGNLVIRLPDNAIDTLVERQ